MEKKYDATYKLGDTIVHVVAPAPMTKGEEDRILREFHQAGYEIWKNLSTEEKLRL